MRKLLLAFVAAFGAVMITAPAWGVSYPITDGTLSVQDGGHAVDAVTPGEAVSVAGSGFAPGSDVRITIESEPRLLATVTAGGSGAVSTTVTIPADMPPGDHTLKATGPSPLGGTVVLSRSISVGAGGVPTASAAEPSGGLLAFTGRNSLALGGIGATIVAVGLLFVAVTRRRGSAIGS